MPGGIGGGGAALANHKEKSDILMLLMLFYLFLKIEVEHCPFFEPKSRLEGQQLEDIVGWGVWLEWHIY